MEFSTKVFGFLAFLTFVTLDFTFAATGCPDLTLSSGQVKYRNKANTVRFRCNDGFERVGSRTAMCLKGKQWSQKVPICLRAGCPALDLPPAITATELHQGAMLYFTCASGYTRQGPDQIYCNGRDWNAVAPTCYEGISLGCDFETEGLCGWSQAVGSDSFDWTRHRGQTPTQLTGPKVDHTLGTEEGYYLFLEASSPRKEGQTVQLVSPKYNPQDVIGICMEFYYHMFGADNANEVGSLKVFIKPNSVPLNRLTTDDRAVSVFEMTDNQGDEWHRQEIDIPPMDEAFQFVFQATKGSSWLSDIALDDIRLYNCGTNATSPAGGLDSTVSPTTATHATDPKSTTMATARMRTPMTTTPLSPPPTTQQQQQSTTTTYTAPHPTTKTTTTTPPPTTTPTTTTTTTTQPPTTTTSTTTPPTTTSTTTTTTQPPTTITTIITTPSQTTTTTISTPPPTTPPPTTPPPTTPPPTTTATTTTTTQPPTTTTTTITSTQPPTTTTTTITSTQPPTTTTTITIPPTATTSTTITTTQPPTTTTTPPTTRQPTTTTTTTTPPTTTTTTTTPPTTTTTTTTPPPTAPPPTTPPPTTTTSKAPPPTTTTTITTKPSTTTTFKPSPHSEPVVATTYKNTKSSHLTTGGQPAVGRTQEKPYSSAASSSKHIPLILGVSASTLFAMLVASVIGYKWYRTQLKKESTYDLREVEGSK